MLRPLTPLLALFRVSTDTSVSRPNDLHGLDDEQYAL